MYLKSTKSCSQSYSNAKHDIYIYIYSKLMLRDLHVLCTFEEFQKGLKEANY